VLRARLSQSARFLGSESAVSCERALFPVADRKVRVFLNKVLLPLPLCYWEESSLMGREYLALQVRFLTSDKGVLYYIVFPYNNIILWYVIIISTIMHYNIYRNI
jgi:hypothetical protein